jgi:hypothetical protein
MSKSEGFAPCGLSMTEGLFPDGCLGQRVMPPVRLPTAEGLRPDRLYLWQRVCSLLDNLSQNVCGRLYIEQRVWSSVRLTMAEGFSLCSINYGRRFAACISARDCPVQISMATYWRTDDIKERLVEVCFCMALSCKAFS